MINLRPSLVGWVVLLDWEGLQESKSDKCLRREEEITSTDKSNAGVA